MQRKTWEGVMKNMTLGAFAFACALTLASTPGHALSFNFMFTCTGTPDCIAPGTVGMVTGRIDGLQDNAANQLPPAAIINSAPSAFNLSDPSLDNPGG